MSTFSRALPPARRTVQPTGHTSREDVAAATEQFDKTLSWLRFPAALEHQFVNDSAARRLRYFLLSGLLSLFVFNGFLLVDYLMAPDVFWLAVKIRVGLFTPFAIIALLSVWLKRHSMSPQTSTLVGECLVLVSGSFAAACLAYILSNSHATTSQYYHVGLMVVIMYGNMVQRLRFWYAVAFSLTVYLIHLGGVMMVPAFNPRLNLPMALLIGATMVFTLMANYALERDERRQYLLSLRRKHLLQDLGEVQQRLQQLSRMDTLTGLFNRRHFQQYLEQTWQRAQYDQAPVAVLMLDVDHFKQYNDRYGHPVGDQCLMQVAQAMQDSLRRPGDLVARYGGEEFIAVLPGADKDTAHQAAERIREAIIKLGIRHEASATAPMVTASIGVVSCRAREGVQEQDLIAAADSALYKAKQAGRNQVLSLSL
ncbi:diguanylate cyclase domain-containing protein [Aquabacterium sp.]|uniref:diguanylate cyclase domain-containing protein n=1 Tax=Aquabacterium sp. TaxID=1872578 RepID=UPI0040376556